MPSNNGLVFNAGNGGGSDAYIATCRAILDRDEGIAPTEPERALTEVIFSRTLRCMSQLFE